MRAWALIYWLVQTKAAKGTSAHRLPWSLDMGHEDVMPVAGSFCKIFHLIIYTRTIQDMVLAGARSGICRSDAVIVILF